MHKLFVKTKILLEKDAFKEVPSFLKNFIDKERCRKEASETEISLGNLTRLWELHDIRDVHFGKLVLALHCYSGDKR